jgi:hypothetical protein
VRSRDELAEKGHGVRAQFFGVRWQAQRDTAFSCGRAKVFYQRCPFRKPHELRAPQMPSRRRDFARNRRGFGFLDAGVDT